MSQYTDVTQSHSSLARNVSDSIYEYAFYRNMYSINACL